MANDILNEARHKVLAENTAQAVYKHLSKLFAEESRFHKRWGWELMQNARDASPPGGVNVWLIQKPGLLIFRHSGLPFNYKSIAHLIYHGSTKYDLTDSGPIGQFGTGFLTTHLISKTVWVKGKTEDGKGFAFQLDRRGDNADQLGDAMEASWNGFTEALADRAPDVAPGFTTEYEYPLTNGVSDVVRQGVDDLVVNAAYVLAFNERIRSIRLENPDRSITIEKRAAEPLVDRAKLLHVEEHTSWKGPMSRYVAIVTGGNGTSVAVELSKADDLWTVADLGQTSRVFVAFPLTATRDFCLPAVVNNEKFQPREDRDTLVLVSNRDGKHLNMILMEEACGLTYRLALLAAEEGWEGAPVLARLNELRQWDWVDSDWLRNLVVISFINPLRASKLLLTVTGERISPRTGMIPLTSGSAQCLDFWDVVADVKHMAERLPRRDQAEIWTENLTAWAGFLQQPPENLDESLTLVKLCEWVTTWGFTEGVREKLEEGLDPIEWLNGLYSLINKAELIQLFEQMRLIPSQSGVLKKITELRCDPGIDEDLKDIAQSLELPIRDGLLHHMVSLNELPEVQSRPQDEILTVAIQKLKEKVNSDGAEVGEIAVCFFAWLIRHNEIGRLEGFPILTRVTSGEQGTFATLLREPAKTDERLLGPMGSWPDPARPMADLFPKGKILADAYWEALPDSALWCKIAEAGYVRLSPLYRTQRRMSFMPDEPLPMQGKDKTIKHRTKDTVDVSALAFFEQDETGLDAVRRSKTRAVRLLQFLTQFVLEEDTGALQPVEADCECGEKHHYYGAAWLVPMSERRWVPLGDSKQSYATAETIAQLFDGKEAELRQLTAGHGRKLLEALNISIADLSLRALAKDENTRISFINSLANITLAAGYDPDKVKLVADEIKQSPKLLDEIKDHRERREKVQRNQSFGAEVERLLKEALESHGLKVTRTGHGSDYEVEEDYVVDDKEVILTVMDGSRSFLIEVKATRGSTARMTVMQAQTAVVNKNRFALCVVPLGSADATPENVQEECRFVMDIGDLIEPVWEEFDRYQDTKRDVCARVGEVELIVHDSEVRFSVTEGAWLGSPLLQDAIKQIMNAFRGTE